MLGLTRIEDALTHLKSLFLEVPRLSFSAEQACPLIGIDEETCLMLLLALLDTRFLDRAPNGAFHLRVDEPLSRAVNPGGTRECRTEGEVAGRRNRGVAR